MYYYKYYLKLKNKQKYIFFKKIWLIKSTNKENKVYTTIYYYYKIKHDFTKFHICQYNFWVEINEKQMISKIVNFKKNLDLLKRS